MKLGILFPQDLKDPVSVRDFVQAVDEIGYNHLSFPDHVFGANPATHKLIGPYTHKSYFHETFTTMAYVAGITRRIELVSTVLILPQRQTGLVAKQAAAIDVLSGGRLRLGVGVGWNAVEYEVLGMNFHDRGKRVDEQVDLLRKFWREELITYQGNWHSVTDAGINPRPLRQSIPIWFGGWSDPMMDRVARLGDGWIASCSYEGKGRTCIEKMHMACEKIGRDPAEIGIQAMVVLNNSSVWKGTNQKAGAEAVRSPDDWRREAQVWQAGGATHLDCWTMYGNLSSPDQHIALARQFMETMQ